MTLLIPLISADALLRPMSIDLSDTELKWTVLHDFHPNKLLLSP